MTAAAIVALKAESAHVAALIEARYADLLARFSEALTAYRQQLEKHVFKSGQLMRPIYARAAARGPTVLEVAPGAIVGPLPAGGAGLNRSRPQWADACGG